MRSTTCLQALAVILLLTGCASNKVRVRCDAHLQPINPPTPLSEAQSPRDGASKAAGAAP